MQGRFKMEYRLFTIIRYNYDYRDYNTRGFKIRVDTKPLYYGVVRDILVLECILVLVLAMHLAL